MLICYNFEINFTYSKKQKCQKPYSCTFVYLLCLKFSSGIFTKVTTNRNVNRLTFFRISRGIGVIGRQMAVFHAIVCQMGVL
jgi:hypothetical protein